jgi:ribulose-5-phosphate 4-epimerase/fuculose-1-phosphate aldolase
LIARGKRIISVHQHSIKFGKGVPTSSWLYGTWQEDGEKAAEMMGDSCTLMIKGHGALVTDATIQDACFNMVHVERTAKMIVMAESVGKVSVFARRGEKISTPRG